MPKSFKIILSLGIKKQNKNNMSELFSPLGYIQISVIIANKFLDSQLRKLSLHPNIFCWKPLVLLGLKLC